MRNELHYLHYNTGAQRQNISFRSPCNLTRSDILNKWITTYPGFYLS